MRELIYLSENKLRSFISYPSPIWKRLLIDSEINLKLGPFGGFKIAAHINPKHDVSHKFNTVLAHIESHVKWYEDRSIQIGEWIAFKVPMNYIITDSYPDYPTIFLNDENANQSKKKRRGVRLLLHGSSKNLIGEHKNKYPFHEHCFGPNGSNVASVYGFVSTLRYAEIEPLSLEPIKLTKDNLRNIVSDLDSFIFDGVQAQESFSGYARVTALDETVKEKKIIFATPLFVERARYSRKKEDVYLKKI